MLRNRVFDVYYYSSVHRLTSIDCQHESTMFPDELKTMARKDSIDHHCPGGYSDERADNIPANLLTVVRFVEVVSWHRNSSSNLVQCVNDDSLMTLVTFHRKEFPMSIVSFSLGSEIDEGRERNFFKKQLFVSVRSFAFFCPADVLCSYETGDDSSD